MCRILGFESASINHLFSTSLAIESSPPLAHCWNPLAQIMSNDVQSLVGELQLSNYMFRRCSHSPVVKWSRCSITVAMITAIVYDYSE